jgi:hypothetical protein
LTVVDEHIIGVKSGKTIAVEQTYEVNLDTANFGRLQGIELLTGREVTGKLAAGLVS